ncbi:twin-arginine translocation pathway signal [Rhodococcus sp. NPDC003348]
MRGPGYRIVWLLAVLAVVLATVAVLLGIRLYRADERGADGARADVAQTAAEGAAALLTYTPDTVAANLYAAAQRLTGEFRDRFGQMTDAVIAPAAREQGISTSATVTGTGVGTLTDDHADALVFLKQVTTTAAAPDPVSATVGARVELTKVDGVWLISDMEVS